MTRTSGLNRTRCLPKVLCKTSAGSAACGAEEEAALATAGTAGLGLEGTAGVAAGPAGAAAGFAGGGVFARGGM